MINKHAYLILTHKNTYTLEMLLALIDDVRNDIYIHVDAKCKDFNYELYKKNVNKSDLYFIQSRVNVSWGGYSIVEAELKLFQSAMTMGRYSHYHLLSGQDLPIKDQDEIHKVCSHNENISFIDSAEIDTNSNFGKIIYRRVSIKRYFTETQKRNSLVINWLDRFILGMQYYILKSDFVRKSGVKLRYGSQWCSLCAAHVKILLDNTDKIKYFFENSSIPDELFVQSIFAETGIEHATKRNMRAILWDEDDKLHPHIWTEMDFEKLKKSDAFFARKFDESIDKKIIDLIVQYLKKR